MSSAEKGGRSHFYSYNVGGGKSRPAFFLGGGGPFCSTEEVVRKGRKDTDPSSPGLREIA